MLIVIIIIVVGYILWLSEHKALKNPIVFVQIFFCSSLLFFFCHKSDRPAKTRNMKPGHLVVLPQPHYSGVKNQHGHPQGGAIADTNMLLFKSCKQKFTKFLQIFKNSLSQMLNTNNYIKIYILFHWAHICKQTHTNKNLKIIFY